MANDIYVTLAVHAGSDVSLLSFLVLAFEALLFMLHVFADSSGIKRSLNAVMGVIFGRISEEMPPYSVVDQCGSHAAGSQGFEVREYLSLIHI